MSKTYSTPKLMVKGGAIKATKNVLPGTQDPFAPERKIASAPGSVGFML